MNRPYHARNHRVTDGYIAARARDAASGRGRAPKRTARSFRRRTPRCRRSGLRDRKPPWPHGRCRMRPGRRRPTTRLSPRCERAARKASRSLAAEYDAAAGGDVDKVDVDACSSDLPSEICEYSRGVLDLHHRHLPLAGDRELRRRERVPDRLGMRDEDVQLCPLPTPDARGGGQVHARIADRGRDTRQRTRRVLNVNCKIDDIPICSLPGARRTWQSPG